MNPTYSRRQVKKRDPIADLFAPAISVAKDIGAGFGELKRQSGQAVQTVKRGIQKIKSAVR